MDPAELNKRFIYHPPIGDQVERYAAIRKEAAFLAGMFNQYCPDSEELELAIHSLRTAVMWANAAIACNENEENSVVGTA